MEIRLNNYYNFNINGIAYKGKFIRTEKTKCKVCNTTRNCLIFSIFVPEHNRTLELPIGINCLSKIMKK